MLRMTLYGLHLGPPANCSEGVAGMDPFSQKLRLCEAVVQRDNVYRDIGDGVLLLALPVRADRE